MEVVMTKERISAALVIGTCRVDKGSAAHDVSHCEVNFQMQGTKTLEASKFVDRDGLDQYTVNKFLSEVFTSGSHSQGKICSIVKESASRKFNMKEETSPALLAAKDVVIAAILKKVGLQTSIVSQQLQILKLKGEITYELKDPSYCYMILNFPKDVCSLASDLAKWLSEVESCKVRKLDAMYNAALFAVKTYDRTNGCIDSQHTPCLQKKILDYFNADNDNDIPNKMGQTSQFLRSNIKVFLQGNSHAKFTPRAIARIMHGLASPSFPSSTWSKTHFWGRTELALAVLYLNKAEARDKICKAIRYGSKFLSNGEFQPRNIESEFILELSTICMLSLVQQLQLDKELKGTDKHKNEQYRAKIKASNERSLALIKAAMDIVVAAGLLQLAPKKITPRVTGAFGFATSLISCYQARSLPCASTLCLHMQI
ncbi:ATP-dependent DNA helicase Q-like 5 protein [Tanacetum coccineum]